VLNITHIDGAYGGFVYPFSNQEISVINFSNPKISSITIDAHKCFNCLMEQVEVAARKTQDTDNFRHGMNG
jgi:glutamate/tyrosine decarboxylase-like PLP-dependent enzyme